jgi:uncharacterized membrane protein
MSMKAFFKWLLFTLVLAAVVHLATVWSFPYAVMAVVAKKSQKQRTALVNTVYSAPKTTPSQRTVVMPSPDLLYSIIGFDLNEGPLHIFAPFPQDTYWSLSFYSTNTVNYFTINDRQAKTNPLEIVLVPDGAAVTAPPNALLIESPSKRGVVLARFLIKDTNRLADLIAVQQQMRSEVLKP